MYETPPPRRAAASWLKGPRLLTAFEKGVRGFGEDTNTAVGNRVGLRVADNE